MKYNKYFVTFGLVLLVILFSGCESTPYDYSALEENRPRSIVVIPPMNNSVEVEASYTFLSTITRPLAEKGYYVFPVAVVDQFFKENGLPTPAEMNTIPLDKIKEHIGADAVLYVEIKNWGQKFQVIASTTVVSAHLKLVDTESGVLLWQATAQAKDSGDNQSNDFLESLIVAVVDQIAGSVADNTYDLSRKANVDAINDAHQGLLDGPYGLPEHSMH